MTEPQTDASMKLLEGIPLPDGRRVAPSVAELVAIERQAADAAMREYRYHYDAAKAKEAADAALAGLAETVAGLESPLWSHSLAVVYRAQVLDAIATARKETT